MAIETYAYHLILGSNLGDRQQQLASAVKLLSDLAGTLKSQSRIYETQPWGFRDQPWFLNQAIEYQTWLGPLELLERLKSIEKQLGREPGEAWHARHIDIDILLCGSMIFSDPKLSIPHPHLQERNFVLVPLMDIASDFVHPVFGKTIEELYLECRDIGEVYIFSPDEHGHSL